MMKAQLFTFLSFVLSFAVLGEVKVQKAPLRSLLIDNASVVTDVTGTDAAKRLEADGGKSWIDGDGRVYRVERRASFRGLSAFSADDPDSTVQWSFDYPGAEYCDLSYDPPSRWYLSYGRMEDVENDGVIWQEEVQYVYEGSAPWGATSVTMKREHYNEEFVLSLAFVTNAADRLATTGEVARIASGISGGLTTNDVCAIVTNEVAVIGDWVVTTNGAYAPGWRIDIMELPGADTPVFDVSLLDHEGSQIVILDTIGTPDPTATCYSGRIMEDVGGYGYLGIAYTAERKRITRNALGLAMAKDVEKKFAEATNAVASIVTNEVAGFTPWEFRFSSDAVAEAAKGWNLELEYLDGFWYFRGVGELPMYHSWEGKRTGGSPNDEVVFVDWFIRNQWDSYWVSVTATRRPMAARNALGLAMAKDLEKLPDHETVTNVARAVSNSFWDEKNEVLWRLEFRDGEPMFVPVTNENVKATGGVL